MANETKDENMIMTDCCEGVFSRFTDDTKVFKYSRDGDICISTDCSTWAKVLLNDMKLSDYIDSEALVPTEDPFTFPNFGTREKTKRRKESVGNYIEECELCNSSMETVHRFNGFESYLVCTDCYEYSKGLRWLNCIYCHRKSTVKYDMFIDGTYKKNILYTTSFLWDTTCKDCIEERYGYIERVPIEQLPTEELYFDPLDQENYYDDEICISCREENSGGGFCYYCRMEWLEI